MDQDFILKKIEALDTRQENYVYFDWFVELGEKILEQQNKRGEVDSLFQQSVDRSIRECLYLIDQRWRYDIDLGEFYYNENMLVNFYYNHLVTIPYRGVSFIMALYFKLKALRGNQKAHLIDSTSTYEKAILDTWFTESCQLTAIAKLLKNKKEEICLEIPLSIGSTDHKN